MFEIAGRGVTLPVRVRDADSWSAQWMVPVERVRPLLEGTGLEPAEPRPGRAMVTLLFVVYRDSDLERYNESAMGIFVRPHGLRPRSWAAKAAEVARGRIGVFIRHMPVTESFSMEAGRTIWGFPKTLAGIAIDRRHGLLECSISDGGTEVLAADIREGGPLPVPTRAAPTYTFIDGTLRVTDWKMRASSARGRRGGTHLTLGDGPMADDLRSLELPREPALTVTFRGFQAVFGEARTIGDALLSA